MQNNSQKDGKAKFSLNVVDILVILFAVACIVGLIFRAVNFSFVKEEEELERHKITFSVSGISASSEKYFKIKDTVRIADSGVKLGTISKIDSITAAVAYVKNADGAIVAAEYPQGTKIDVVGTINSGGIKTAGGYLLNGNKRIAPGDSYYVRTEHMDFILTILEIE